MPQGTHPQNRKKSVCPDVEDLRREKQKDVWWSSHVHMHSVILLMILFILSSSTGYIEAFCFKDCSKSFFFFLDKGISFVLLPTVVVLATVVNSVSKGSLVPAERMFQVRAR